MNRTNLNTPDVIIYVHPELSADVRAKIENDLMGISGVLSAHFDEHKHALKVLYNLDKISEEKILASARKFDSTASLVGL